MLNYKEIDSLSRKTTESQFALSRLNVKQCLRELTRAKISIGIGKKSPPYLEQLLQCLARRRYPHADVVPLELSIQRRAAYPEHASR